MAQPRRPDGGRRPWRTAVAVTVAVLATLVLGVPGASAQTTETYYASFGGLNSSGASGEATFTLTGTTLTVELEASGLSPNLPHAQHLHIVAEGPGKCPPPSADANMDGLITTVEGQPFYGDIQISLTTSGGTAPADALALDRMPVADGSGNVTYSRTFEIPVELTDDIGRAVLVQHGIDFDNSGAYDGEADSSVDPSVPLEATIPADCGRVADTDDRFDGVLHQLNRSGDGGIFSIIVDRFGAEPTLTVAIVSSGLSPNLPHAMHLHGPGMSVCPPAEADTDGDGFVSVAEGVPFYGDIDVSLTTSGDTSPSSALALDRFPVASASGQIWYNRTITVTPEIADNIAAYQIVQHGIDLNGSGEYDGTKPSSVNPDVPFEATVPSDCGQVLTFGESPPSPPTQPAEPQPQPVDGDYAPVSNTRQDQVFRLYQAAFDRAPDQNGLVHWVSSNLSLPQIAAEFVGSAEFQAKYGQLSNQAYVKQLYQNILGRAGEQAGVTYWTNQIQQGLSRANVLLEFANSAELRTRIDATYAPVSNTRQDQVFRLYQAAFDRAPDQNGLVHWVSSNLGLPQIAAEFVASAEFQAKYGQLSNQAYVEQLYQNILGRAGEQAGVTYWTNQIQQGLSRANVLLEFANSAELRTRLGS